MVNLYYFLLFLCCISRGFGLNVTVDTTQISSWTISPHLESVGIEYLNHEIYGNGLYSQMIFGESFEEMTGTYTPNTNTVKSIVSSTTMNGLERIRHCDFQLYITNIDEDSGEDFQFDVLSPGLNGKTGTVSFESVNFNGYYITLATNTSNTETTRLGIVESTNTANYNDSASYDVVPALNGISKDVSFKVSGGKYMGYFLGSNNKLEGDCKGNYKSPDSDVILIEKPISSQYNDCSFSYINITNNVPISELGYIGCGAGRAMDKYHVNAISEMWMAETTGSTNYKLLRTYSAYSLITDSANSFNGNKYQQINFDNNLSLNGFKSIGLANYGLNCQLGLFFISGKDYNGYIYLRNNGSGNTNKPINIQLNIFNDNTQIISSPISINVSNTKTWNRYNFNFIISGMNSTCFQDQRGYYQCNGKFVISLINPGDIIDIDLTYLTAGNWGIRNYTGSGSLGLPARKELADMFEFEGLKVLRMGGAMCNEDEYRWKYFRGARDLREPYQGHWYRQNGLTQSRGFGMFEIIDLCSEIGCQPIITINNEETPSDMADFIEYCYGDNTTEYGALRIEDGHPDIYNLSWIEIGNEQGLDTIYLNQILSITQSMEAKIKSMNLDIGTDGFRYCIGHNLINSQVSYPITAQYILNLTYLGDRIFWDLHVPGDPSAVAEWETMIVNFQKLVNSLNSKMRFVILEENGNDHGLLRGLGHALYNSIFILYGDFGRVHGYANAIEAWQGMDTELAVPQGQLFYLPNMTWGQPTFWVERMTSQNYLPYNIDVEYMTTNNFNAVAASSTNKVGDSMDINIYFVNWGQSGIDINIKMKNTKNVIKNNVITLTILEGITGDNNEENSPSKPMRISPKTQQTSSAQSFTVGKMSFVIASLTVNP